MFKKWPWQSEKINFRDNGFRAVSVLRDYYGDSGEDGYKMRYRLADQAEEETP